MVCRWSAVLLAMGWALAAARAQQMPGMSMPGMAAAAPATSESSCIRNPTTHNCTDYKYPEASIQADMHELCDMMPYMIGCSIWRACQVRGTRLPLRTCQAQAWYKQRSCCSLSGRAGLLRRAYSAWFSGNCGSGCNPAPAGGRGVGAILPAHEHPGGLLHRHGRHVRLHELQGALPQPAQRGPAVQRRARGAACAEDHVGARRSGKQPGLEGAGSRVNCPCLATATRPHPECLVLRPRPAPGVSGLGSNSTSAAQVNRLLSHDIFAMLHEPPA